MDHLIAGNKENAAKISLSPSRPLTSSPPVYLTWAHVQKHLSIMAKHGSI